MSVLISGIQKTGNTLCRFVIFNYFNILNNSAKKTLTWDELEAPHLLRQKYGIDHNYQDGFPNVHHTHVSYDGWGVNVNYEDFPSFYEQFDKLIYVIRNPFDTMISYFHFMMNRDRFSFSNISKERLEKMKGLKGFVEFYLPKFIHHVKTTRHRADLVLDYDMLMNNKDGFRKAIELIDNDVNLSILQQSIEMSSFDNIRNMSIRIKQPYGLGGVRYKGFFCRDGRSGQYLSFMSKELIEWITNECKEKGLKV